MPEKTVQTPEGVEVKLEGSSLVVRGPKGELSREFRNPKIRTEIKAGQVRFSTEEKRRRTLALLGTWAAHLRNMITGVTKGWEARMKVVYSHFPIKLGQEGDRVLIQNFMGERKPRIAIIVGETKIELKKDEIVISGINKEEVGQTCGNLESITKVRGYDRRVFQDGIYILHKPKPSGEEQKSS
jgi:large subunit ribosomal protein L6